MELQLIGPGHVWVTDIAAGNAETAFGGGTRTLAALIDLANICQAVVMYDQIIVSPFALENNSLLRELKCAATLTVEEEPEESPPEGHGRAEDEAKVDGAVRGDEIFRVMVASLAVRLRDKAFSNLVNLKGALGATEDKGKYAIGKLPAAMLLFQAIHGDDVFSGPEARASVLEGFGETPDLFRAYSKALVDLYEVHGVDNVSSAIELPLLDAGRLDDGFESGGLDDMFEVVSSQIDRSIEQCRAMMLTKWRLPALGLYVLSQAKGVDEIPRVLSDTREGFADLRRTMTAFEVERRQARSAMQQGDESAMKDIARLKTNLQSAFDAFSRKITDPAITRDIRRNDRVMDGARLADTLTGLITSMGLSALSSLESVLKQLKVDQWLQMRVVPGLFKAAATLENMGDETVGRVVGRYLDLPPERLAFPRIALGFCFARIESRYDPSAMDATAGIRDEEGFLPAKDIWVQMLKDDTARDIWLTGRMD